MFTEPLQLLPISKWGDLKFAAQSDWPRNMFILTLLESEENFLNLDIEYGFNVFCPQGDINKGMVAFNTKNSLHEFVVQCPSNDTTYLEEALRTTALIDWSKQIKVPFAPKHVSDCIKRIICEKNYKIDISVVNTYFLDKGSSLFDVSLASDLSFKLLSLDYVDLVNSMWPRKFPGSEWYFELLIKAQLGYGLFKNGELTAWSFINEMGAICHFYTMEDHRRNGYGELVVKLISNFLLKQNKFVYTFCDVGNVKASNLYKKVGFASILDTDWFVLTPN